MIKKIIILLIVLILCASSWFYFNTSSENSKEPLENEVTTEMLSLDVPVLLNVDSNSVYFLSASQKPQANVFGEEIKVISFAKR